ncbi:MAG: CTP synthase [Planctomycetota bacterium]
MPEPSRLLQDAGHTSQESEFFNPLPPGYTPGRHKFVVVMGTVMSGLGKGIFASSLAKLLKDKRLRVAPLKMEGYLNIDSGTLNPYRHGEVFVLDDGMECDMDLGTYERMLDQDLSRENYTTSGQIYRKVLDKERNGGYQGRDVQMIPHVTGEVKYLLRDMAVRRRADVVFVEVGGTVGDHENAFYIEALRQLAFEEGKGSVCFVALTYIIEPPALGEQKSKAAQLGLKKLLEAGIQPHIVACRAKNPVEAPAKQKIAMFSNVPLDCVFSMHDRSSIYTIPTALRNEGIDTEVLSALELHTRIDQRHEDEQREKWRGFVARLQAPKRHACRVGITGKYASLRDAYASIDKALEHVGAALSAKVETDWIDTTDLEPDGCADAIEHFDAVIVPGGFGTRGVESKIACVQYCREAGVPFLGICLGFQMAVVEFARNVLGLKDAGSTEFAPDSQNAVISLLPGQESIRAFGGSMRLGGQDVEIAPGTLASRLFGFAERGGTVRQRFRHRYEVEPRFIEPLTDAGLVFCGKHPDQPIMQALELPQDPAKPNAHPYFVGGQFHPELLSRPLGPHPMFMGLVAAALRRRTGEGFDEQVLPEPYRLRQPQPAPA